MLWTALILGAAGSLHCAGMCGPLMLALPATGKSRWGFVQGRLVYQAGRLFIYGLVGIVFGLLGKSLAVIGLQRWVSLFAGILLLAGLAALIPGRASAALVSWIGWLKSTIRPLLQQRSLGSMLVLGGLNGLLPCGLVYAAAAGAAATGSEWQGLAYMLVFGLGTLPLLLAFSLFGPSLPVSFRLQGQRWSPVLLGLVGVLLVLRGLALGIPYLSPDLAAQASCCH